MDPRVRGERTATPDPKVLQDLLVETESMVFKVRKVSRQKWGIAVPPDR
jgi:hypothetical protein